MLFETGRWKLRRKCNRRDIERGARERGKVERERERQRERRDSYELKLLNQMN